MTLFMVAGTDTSSVTLTFCLLLLLNNPGKLKKLAVELDEAFPSRDDPITFEKTNNLPYLNAALNESMRVMPVAVGTLCPHFPSQHRSLYLLIGPTAFGRLVTEPVVVNGYEIPPGVIQNHISSSYQSKPQY